MARSAILATIWALCSAFVMLTFGAGLADSTFSGKVLSQRILRDLDSQTVVAELDEHVHALPYYLDRRLVHIDYVRETQFMKRADLDGWMFDGVDDFMRSLKSGQRPLIVAKAHDFDAAAYPGFTCERVGAWMIMTAPAR